MSDLPPDPLLSKAPVHLHFDNPLDLTIPPSVQAQLDRIEHKLDAALKTLTLILPLVDRRPAKFVITLTPISTQGEGNMAKILKATVDFQLLDNGTAQASLGEIDSVGLPTNLPVTTPPIVPVWTASDPTAIAVTPAADGMSAVVAPATPPKLATGVSVSVSAQLPNNPDGSAGATISGTSQLIDITAGPAASFVISLQ